MIFFKILNPFYNQKNILTCYVTYVLVFCDIIHGISDDDYLHVSLSRSSRSKDFRFKNRQTVKKKCTAAHQEHDPKNTR